MRTTGKLGLALAFILILMAFGLISCTLVKISESFHGVVVDAESGVPVAHVAIRVRVMRVSSYDDTTQFARYTHKSNQHGKFKLPARKKIVESITERMEDMRYYEFIAFDKRGYESKEFCTDDDQGPFAVSNALDRSIVVRLRKMTVEPSP